MWEPAQTYFPIRTRPASEPRPKPSYSEMRPMPRSGTYIGRNHDDEAQQNLRIKFWFFVRFRPKQKEKLRICSGYRHQFSSNTTCRQPTPQKILNSSVIFIFIVRHISRKHCKRWFSEMQPIGTYDNNTNALNLERQYPVVRSAEKQLTLIVVFL